MKGQEIRQNLYELRRQGRERYLKLMGVDVEKLRELEQAIDSEYGELAASLQQERRKEGEERAARHAKVLEIRRAALSQDAEKALHAELTTQAAILDHLDIAIRDWDIVQPIWWCHCHYTTWLSPDLGHGDTITIDPPAGGSGVGTVNYVGAMGQAQPYASVSGQGTGTINTAQVNTWFKFAFTPATDDPYCIRPIVFMNGWWLLWTWGACGGTSEDLGSGTVRVKLKVRVDQLSAKVKEIEHTVLDQNLAGGAGHEGAVDYVSETDGGASMMVYLQGGHEAVIFVECEVYTQMSNHGRAIVDMQSGSGFYFWVSEVLVGRRHCHWPWLELEPLQRPPIIPGLPRE